MFVKSFKDIVFSAYTLDPEEVCENHDGNSTGKFSRTHADGWTISGYVSEDWFTWVNEFEASHPDFGRVWGDFEEVVYADSEEAYVAFFAAHTPHEWDYGDI